MLSELPHTTTRAANHIRIESHLVVVIFEKSFSNSVESEQEACLRVTDYTGSNEFPKAYLFFFQTLSDLNQAVPSLLADESQTR